MKGNKIISRIRRKKKNPLKYVDLKIIEALQVNPLCAYVYVRSILKELLDICWEESNLIKVRYWPLGGLVSRGGRDRGKNECSLILRHYPEYQMPWGQPGSICIWKPGVQMFAECKSKCRTNDYLIELYLGSESQTRIKWSMLREYICFLTSVSPEPSTLLHGLLNEDGLWSSVALLYMLGTSWSVKRFK